MHNGTAPRKSTQTQNNQSATEKQTKQSNIETEKLTAQIKKLKENDQKHVDTIYSLQETIKRHQESNKTLTKKIAELTEDGTENARTILSLRNELHTMGQLREEDDNLLQKLNMNLENPINNEN